VPKVTGLLIEAAYAALKTAGCIEGPVTGQPGTAAMGTVISQSLAPGTKPPAGAKVSLVISEG
jgi:beta-lactam-binding protein with PASTA domain